MLSLRTFIGSWRSRPFRILLAGIGVSSIVGIATGVLLTSPELVRVEHVSFVGNHRATSRSLRHLSDIRNGAYIWDVDLDTAIRGVRKHSWVRDATAYRTFPNSVVIEIKEYHPVAMVMADELLYVDESGEPFLNADTSDLNFPVITGVTQGVVTAHPDLPRAVVKEAVELLASLEETKLLYREQISEVAFDSAMGWTVFVNEGARFQFGLENMPKQLRRLGRVLDNGVSLDDPVVVDLAPKTVAIVKPVASNF